MVSGLIEFSERGEHFLPMVGEVRLDSVTVSSSTASNTCAKDMRIFACQLCGALINRTANEVSNTCGKGTRVYA